MTFNKAALPRLPSEPASEPRPRPGAPRAQAPGDESALATPTLISGPHVSHLRLPPHWTGPWRARGTDLLGVLLPEVPDVHVVLVHGREVEEGEGEGEVHVDEPEQLCAAHPGGKSTDVNWGRGGGGGGQDRGRGLGAAGHPHSVTTLGPPVDTEAAGPNPHLPLLSVPPPPRSGGAPAG